MEQHFVELGHALDLDQPTLHYVEVVPESVEVQVNVLLHVLAGEALLLGEQLFRHLQGSLFINPVLSQFRLVLFAAGAVTAALHGAHVLGLANGLKVEAAATVATAVGVIGAEHGVALENQSMALENKSIHQFVVVFA